MLCVLGSLVAFWNVKPTDQIFSANLAENIDNFFFSLSSLHMGSFVIVTGFTEIHKFIVFTQLLSCLFLSEMIAPTTTISIIIKQRNKTFSLLLLLNIIYYSDSNKFNWISKKKKKKWIAACVQFLVWGFAAKIIIHLDPHKTHSDETSLICATFSIWKAKCWPRHKHLGEMKGLVSYQLLWWVFKWDFVLRARAFQCNQTHERHTDVQYRRTWSEHWFPCSKVENPFISKV